jgi:hypothetical protein
MGYGTESVSITPLFVKEGEGVRLSTEQKRGVQGGFGMKPGFGMISQARRSYFWTSPNSAGKAAPSWSA